MVNKIEFLMDLDDEYLTRCVVDASTRTFLIYSSEGNEQVIQCDNTEEFMNVLNYVRKTVGPDILSYAEPLIK